MNEYDSARVDRVHMYLYLAAALGRSSVHEPQHVQTHVVLAASSQRETETRRTSFQVHAVEL